MAASSAYDNAGSLIDDGKVLYDYDAWKRLEKVRPATATGVKVQTAEFEGMAGK